MSSGQDLDLQICNKTTLAEPARIQLRRTLRGAQMNSFKRSGRFLTFVSALAMISLSAHAQEPPRPTPGGPGGHGARPGPAARPTPGRPGPGGPHDARFAHGGPLPARNFGGHAYHGRLAWEGGAWRHEMHNGRFGWWWDVGGAWYFYPQPMAGPPAYVSDVEFVDDMGPGGPPVADGYPPPPGAYPPPAAAYAPPPPPPAPPPPDPAASIVGGAVVGGLLGGLITHRPVGALAGAVAGGTVGAIAGAQAARRPGYYWSQDGACYFRYPSGQYAPVDPANCG
jgi:hypothetical protein